ncbi:MAG TPA: protein phosphatase 2C domain-containing protein [Ktedonobacteraceae bacterium]
MSSFITKMWREVCLLVGLDFERPPAEPPRVQIQERARYKVVQVESPRGAAPMEPQQLPSEPTPSGSLVAPVVPNAAPLHGQSLSDLRCPQCNQVVPVGATFCTYCGTLLVASALGGYKHLKMSPSSSPAPSSAQPATSSGSVPQWTLPPTLPSPAYSMNDEPTGQISPGQPGSGQADAAWAESSDEELPLIGRVLSLAVGAFSHPGILRQYKPNEDSLFAAQGMRFHRSQPQPFGLFIAADGMGGHVHGQEASRLGIQTMVDWILPTICGRRELHEADFRQLLIDGVQAANQAIHRRNKEQFTEMGTTITAALVVDRTAIVANVGDSRTYLYRASQGLRKITKDHSLVAYLVENGIIQAEDIYIHPQRNQIYRSLGIKPVIQVDVFTEQLQPKDTLLLCSDGLWEMVRDPSIQQILRQGTHPSRMGQALIDAALEGGGADNISAIVVQVTEARRSTTAAVGIHLLAKPATVEMPDLQRSEPKQSWQE